MFRSSIYAIAHVIEQRSEDVLQIEHGSLYPALHRLENRGWIASFWDTSEWPACRSTRLPFGSAYWRAIFDLILADKDSPRFAKRILSRFGY